MTNKLRKTWGHRHDKKEIQEFTINHKLEKVCGMGKIRNLGRDGNSKLRKGRQSWIIGLE